MYDPELVRPMREELARAGFQELKTAQEVDDWMAQQDGTALLVINSVCGCAAGSARPGVRLSLESDARPQRLATVFAGQDKEATDRARSYFADFPPSSPSLALFKNGKVVHFVPRHRIEGKEAVTVANDLAKVYGEHCSKEA